MNASYSTPFSGQIGDALSLPYLLSSITNTEHDIQSTLDTVRGESGIMVLPTLTSSHSISAHVTPVPVMSLPNKLVPGVSRISNLAAATSMPALDLFNNVTTSSEVSYTCPRILVAWALVLLWVMILGWLELEVLSAILRPAWAVAIKYWTVQLAT
ncbi:g11709 [Coccomyxa viridis]|uniref:G11709 protein n=1 Tax=Coccomyxa viridis TaxID=1274662 RepID=A0ABP1GFL7_9CHLO